MTLWRIRKNNKRVEVKNEVWRRKKKVRLWRKRKKERKNETRQRTTIISLSFFVATHFPPLCLSHTCSHIVTPRKMAAFQVGYGVVWVLLPLFAVVLMPCKLAFFLLLDSAEKKRKGGQCNASKQFMFHVWPFLPSSLPPPLPLIKSGQPH